MRRVAIGALIGLVGLLVLGWVAYGALLWRFQEAMIFPAPGGIGTDALDSAAAELGAEPIHLEAADGTALYGWYKPAATPQPSRRVVLYFHGNAETVAAPSPLMRLATQEGWDFATVAFRGYPGSEGEPSEAGLALDARALWDWVIAEKGIAPEHVVLHGRSLGGAVAARLASDVDPGALVLESTFTSMVAMAERSAPTYPVRRLLRHPFDTDQRVASLDLPALVLHGDADGIVDVSHGRALADQLRGAELVVVPGGVHNELLVLADPAARRAWLALLEQAASSNEE